MTGKSHPSTVGRNGSADDGHQLFIICSQFRLSSFFQLSGLDFGNFSDASGT